MRFSALAACVAAVACAGALAGVNLGAREAAAGPTAFCTKAQKRTAQKVLVAFRKAMPARQRAYFKRVRSTKKRKAFVKAQRLKLKRLQVKAACRVRKPAPKPPTSSTSPTTTVPGPAPSPPASGPDLAVSVSPPSAAVSLHEPVSFTIEVVNRGSAPATDVTLVDALPASLRRITAHSCEGTTTIRCSLGTLEPTAGRAIRVVLRPLEPGTLTHTPSATSSSADVAPANNAAAATVTATPLPAFATPAPTGFSFQLSRPWFADDRGSSFPWTGEWPKTEGVFHPGTGTLRGAVIFVDFPDHPGSGSISTDEALALLERDSQAWYREASYGRLTLDLESAGGWHRMSRPVDDYGIGSCCSVANLRVFAAEAIELADATFDFSQTDAVWVIGPSSAWQQMAIMIDQRWPGAGVSVDGRELRRWISAPAAVPSVPMQVEPARYSHWVVTHEVGHFFGLPDLYDKPIGCPSCPNSFEWVGWWDLMSDVPAHAHFLAWHKWLLGWLDPAQLREVPPKSEVVATLTPLAAPGGLKAVVAPLTSSLAYVVEARAPMGWESGLCDRGVLVYTVDSTKRNAEGPVHVMPAHGVTTSTACGPIFDAAFGIGPGEQPLFEDPYVKVEVLEALADGSYRVRVTQQ